ncbi:MAG TPA: Imm50 family immunity protein [Pseudomonadales bacterium]|nr:Imm50 family immunity protein [Pseudomonadales bacterium]
MNDIVSNRINGKESLISRLGYWPEFCDAKILELNFSSSRVVGASLSILLHYIDADKNLDANIRIFLEGISDVEFNELRMENVVDCIDLAESNDGVVFSIEACAGLSGSCACETANVQLISLKAYTD